MKSSAPEPGLLSSAREPARKLLDQRRDRMLEALDDDVFDFGGRQLRLDVDGDAVVGRVVDDAHLVVRALPGAQPDLDGLPLQHTVRAQRH